MTTWHSTIEFFAGDDWEIVATLLDENGQPYDLSTSPTIKWRLVDFNGVPVMGDEAVVTIINAAQGICSILIASSVTTKLKGGLYTDSIRLTMSGRTGTLASGPVNVLADPWRSAQQTPQIVQIAYSRDRELRRI